MSPRVRLGDLLIKAGMITQAQLDDVLALQSRDGRRLGTLLVEAGLVTETQVTQILSQQLSVPWVSLYHIDFSRQLLNLVPHEVADRNCLVPIFVRRVRGLGDCLYVAMDDPGNDRALAEVQQHSGLPVRSMIAPPSDIRNAIHAYYGGGETEQEHGGPEVEVTEGTPEPHDDLVVAGEPARSVDETPAEAPSLDPVVPDASPAVTSEGTDEPVVVVQEKAPPSVVPAREPSMPPGKRAGNARFIELTLLDGTTVRLPAKTTKAAPTAARPGSEEQLTARDLVAALRAVSHGADASEILGENVRWEAMFAALLSLLLKKHLIADWEFVDEIRKI